MGAFVCAARGGPEAGPWYSHGMAGRVEGKVAIITGAASGIGRATALTLAREGAAVALADLDADGVQRAADEVTAAGGEAIGLEADAADKASVERAVARAVERFGGLDILVNCAAIAAGGAIDQVTEEQWDRVLAVNLKGVMFFCQAVLPHLRERGGGVIVNFSSGSGFRPSGRSLAYGASKAAVAHVSRSLAHDLGVENYPREHHRPRAHRHPHDPRQLQDRRGHAPGRHRLHPADRDGRLPRTGRSGQRRPLPRLRRGAPHHGADPPRQRGLMAFVIRGLGISGPFAAESNEYRLA